MSRPVRSRPSYAPNSVGALIDRLLHRLPETVDEHEDEDAYKAAMAVFSNASVSAGVSSVEDAAGEGASSAATEAAMLQALASLSAAGPTVRSTVRTSGEDHLTGRIREKRVDSGGQIVEVTREHEHKAVKTIAVVDASASASPDARAARSGAARVRSALIVSDMQNDLLDGLPNASSLVSAVNALRVACPFEVVAITQDWHPPNHISFASRHGKPVGTVLESGIRLTKDHCIAASKGAALHALLVIDGADFLIRKGTHADIDTRSAFCEADGMHATPLAEILTTHGIGQVVLCGLGFDEKICQTALEALALLGCSVLVVSDACAPGAAATRAKLEAAGVQLVTSAAARALLQ